MFATLCGVKANLARMFFFVTLAACGSAVVVSAKKPSVAQLTCLAGQQPSPDKTEDGTIVWKCANSCQPGYEYVLGIYDDGRKSVMCVPECGGAERASYVGQLPTPKGWAFGTACPGSEQASEEAEYEATAEKNKNIRKKEIMERELFLQGKAREKADCFQLCSDVGKLCVSGCMDRNCKYNCVQSFDKCKTDCPR